MKKPYSYLQAAMIVSTLVVPVGSLVVAASLTDLGGYQVTHWPEQITEALPPTSSGMGDNNPVVNVNSNANVNANTNTNTNTTATDNSETVNVSGDSSIRVSRDAVKASSNTVGTASSTGDVKKIESKDVSKPEDLKTYAAGSIQADENLQEMNFDDSKVEVSYKSRGRFLALIPVTRTITVNVNAKGDVSIKYPWYDFLVMNQGGDLESSIKTRIQSMLQASVDGKLTSRQEAEIAASIQEELRADYNK